jgi:hypothetical protein
VGICEHFRAVFPVRQAELTPQTLTDIHSNRSGFPTNSQDFLQRSGKSLASSALMCRKQTLRAVPFALILTVEPPGKSQKSIPIKWNLAMPGCPTELAAD